MEFHNDLTGVGPAIIVIPALAPVLSLPLFSFAKHSSSPPLSRPSKAPIHPLLDLYLNHLSSIPKEHLSQNEFHLRRPHVRRVDNKDAQPPLRPPRSSIPGHAPPHLGCLNPNSRPYVLPHECIWFLVRSPNFAFLLGHVLIYIEVVFWSISWAMWSYWSCCWWRCTSVLSGH
jgi:hypothetical protein